MQEVADNIEVHPVTSGLLVPAPSLFISVILPLCGQDSSPALTQIV